jgi:hypothetical protein
MHDSPTVGVIRCIGRCCHDGVIALLDKKFIATNGMAGDHDDVG